MGWSVSQHSEPERKLGSFANGLRRLRGAIRSGKGPVHVAKASERVRRAALSLIKARRTLIQEYPQRDPDGRQSRNLDRQEELWLSFSSAGIAEEYGTSGASSIAATD